VVKKVPKSLSFGQEEAAQALQALVAEGRVKAHEVRAVLKREKLLREFRKRLAALGDEGFKLLDSVRRERWVARKAGRKAKRRISGARRAAMKVQGKYLAAVRRLPKAARVRMKAIREKSGVRAAIAAAKRIGMS
jgi:hypothetical protein